VFTAPFFPPNRAPRTGKSDIETAYMRDNHPSRKGSRYQPNKPAIPFEERMMRNSQNPRRGTNPYFEICLD
jgi:hypothetical protein